MLGLVQDVFLTLKLVHRPDEVFKFTSPRPDEKVIERLVRDYHERRNAPVTFDFDGDATLDFGAVRWSPTGESPEVLVSAPLTRDVTFESLESAFGEELHDPAGPVSINITYSGGDGSSLIAFLDLAGHVSLIWAGVKGSRVLVDKVMFRRERDAIARWRNTGVVDDDLRRQVGAFSVWDADAVSRRFAVTDGERGELMRACGYEYRHLEWSDEIMWVRTDGDLGA